MLAHTLLLMGNDELEYTISPIEYLYGGGSDCTAVALESNQHRQSHAQYCQIETYAW